MAMGDQQTRQSGSDAEDIAENPISSRSPEAKLLAALVLVVGIVLCAPLDLLEVLFIVFMVTAVALIAEANVRQVYLRSLLVLPVAGAMALFTPLRYVESWTGTGLLCALESSWQQALGLVLVPWLCVLVMMVYAQVSPPSQMLVALERLRVPHILVLLLTFIYRYLDTLRDQVVSMRRALISRAPSMSRHRQVLLYGNLAGSLLIRSYDRGDRIYHAMLSRGFTGTLPQSRRRPFTVADAALITGALTLIAALALYG